MEDFPGWKNTTEKMRIEGRRYYMDMCFPEKEKKKWIEWELKSKKYLYGKKLVREKYPITEDHTHCEFCWGKFGKDAENRKIGYHEKETNSWICDECYDIFKTYFYWKLI